MFKVKQFIFLIVLFNLNSGIVLSKHSDRDASENIPDNQMAKNRIKEFVASYVNTNNFSGNILVIKEGNVIFEQSYGMANIELDVPVAPGTKFYIASITKSFTAAAIMQLQEKGLLDIGDPVSKYITNYPAGDKIIIQHLLNHTSGIPRIFVLPDYEDIARRETAPETLVDLMKDQPLMFEPGDGYGYSGPNYHLLSYIIELITGMTYGDYIRENLLEPLDMKDTNHQASWRPLVKHRATGYDPVGMVDVVNTAFYDYSTSVGSGSMYSTASDLYKWYKGLLSYQLLKPESLDHVLKKLTILDREVYSLCGWSNTGFSSSTIYSPEMDITIIALCNFDISFVTNEITAGIFKILLGENTQGLSIFQKPVDPELADQISGTYQFGDDWYTPRAIWRILVKNGQVFGEDPDGKLVGFLRISEHEFIHRASWGRAKFEEENGKIERMLFYGRFWAEKIDK